ncbi:hypothetical protein BX600DRAFT_517698 [Xylariales sp. PMI_506]|nr:hypothetical protein BX600DRAFT_517698 [Xylariales sp. PMI_506]
MEASDEQTCTDDISRDTQDFWDLVDWDSTGIIPEPYTFENLEFPAPSAPQIEIQTSTSMYDLDGQVLSNWLDQQASQHLPWLQPDSENNTLAPSDPYLEVLRDSSQYGELMPYSTTPSFGAPSAPSEPQPGNRKCSSERHNPSLGIISSERGESQQSSRWPDQNRRNSTTIIPDGSKVKKRASRRREQAARRSTLEYQDARDELAAMADRLDHANKRQQIIVAAFLGTKE